MFDDMITISRSTFESDLEMCREYLDGGMSKKDFNEQLLGNHHRNLTYTETLSYANALIAIARGTHPNSARLCRDKISAKIS